MEPKIVNVKSAGLKVVVMDSEDDAIPSSEVYIIVLRSGSELLRLTIDGDTASVTYRRPLSVSKRKRIGVLA